MDIYDTTYEPSSSPSSTESEESEDSGLDEDDDDDEMGGTEEGISGLGGGSDSSVTVTMSELLSPHEGGQQENCINNNNNNDNNNNNGNQPTEQDSIHCQCPPLSETEGEEGSDGYSSGQSWSSLSSSSSCMIHPELADWREMMREMRERRKEEEDGQRERELAQAMLTSVRVYAMAAALGIPSLMMLARDRFDWAVERHGLHPLFPAVVEAVYSETDPSDWALKETCSRCIYNEYQDMDFRMRIAPVLRSNGDLVKRVLDMYANCSDGLMAMR